MSDLLIHVSRRAMASEFEVRFPAERYPQGTEASLAALDQVEATEEQLSYFRATSEVSRVNLLAADEPVEVSSSLFSLLQQAAKLYEETKGAYDITSTPLWEAWGFARRAGEIPSDAQLAEARTCVGGHLMELDPSRQTVRFCRPGVKINLGSIGKGYALDICGERLQALGVNDYLIHGGQSSVLAHGCSVSTPLNAWEVGIRHPRQPGRRLGIVRLSNRALGTSSSQFQGFRYRGRRYGHILDPRTGQPAESVYSTTVVAPTAAMADALSTAFYVMGLEKSLEYCQTHQEIGLCMTCPGQHGGDMAVHTIGFGENELVCSDAC